MMAERAAQSYCPVTIVPESMFLRPDGSKPPKAERSHMATTHYGFVPKHSHHGGKSLRFALKKLFSLGQENKSDFILFVSRLFVSLWAD